MSDPEKSHVTEMYATQKFDARTLAEIERALHGRLRAHHISDAFFDRHGEDSVQRGLVEYLRVQGNGVEIREPRAFVLQAAFRRAIDELRREVRRGDGGDLELALEIGPQVAVPAEEEAIESIEAERLQTALESLPPEERRVLALRFFEEVGERQAAELLFISERTFRRRLKRSLDHLGRLLGAPPPEPGSHHGLEVGLAAWAAVAGGREVIASGAPGHLASALESLHALPGRVIGRLRGPGTRLVAAEVPERIGALAGGPAGRILGGCAGAAVACVLTGVVGPGIGGGHAVARPSPEHHVALTQKRPLRAALHPIVIHPQEVEESSPPVAVPAEPVGASASPTQPTQRYHHEEARKPGQGGRGRSAAERRTAGRRTVLRSRPGGGRSRKRDLIERSGAPRRTHAVLDAGRNEPCRDRGTPCRAGGLGQDPGRKRIQLRTMSTTERPTGGHE